ncbi:MAG: hypothetical protein GY755_01075 [Chloroflexi bacterium]|nr:hypothetical protein [Chloroflexota bacterium]
MLKKYWWLLLLIIILAVIFGLSFCQQEDLAPLICTEPLMPEDGAEISYGAHLMSFAFTEMEGIALYHLNIQTPSGHLVTFELDGTQVERIISTFTEPGENIWYVEAINDDREIVCTSDSFTFFTMQEPEPVPEVKEEEPEPTPTFTPEPILSEDEGCSQLLTPEDGAELPYIGKVIFSWTKLEDATKYILTITMPSGNIVTFESDKTEIARYMEAFEQGGEYQWSIIVLNAAGEEICESTLFSLTKPQLPENKSQGDGTGAGEEKPPTTGT